MYKITLLVLFTGLLWPCEAQENNTFLSDFNDNPTWTESYNGVWKSVVNQPQEVNLLNTSGSSPREEDLAKIEGSKFPLEKTEIKAFSKNGKTYIRLPLEDGERIFG